MQLSEERQEEIKQLIKTGSFRNLACPAEIKLFCIDALIMYYNKLLPGKLKIFFCCCPFCEFFTPPHKKGHDCINCPWTEQFTHYKEYACARWLESNNLTWEDFAQLATLRLPMLWAWREIYNKQLTS